MPHKRFYMRLVLHLHAVTCPGVWLCSHGSLEATIKTLGYYFRTGAMEPRFPMLCHDEFTMEGYFKGVNSIDQMRDMLNSEQLEITMWQNGRRLAYYLGRLSDLMQPPVPPLSCEHSANVQLLMKATSAFPGILAPKVEISAELTTRDKHRKCCKVNLEREISNRHAQSRCLSRLELPRKQKTVCHSKGSNCSTDTSLARSTSSQLLYEQQSRRLSSCSITTRHSSQSLASLSTISDSTQCSHSNSNFRSQSNSLAATVTFEHETNCHICQAYSRFYESS
ncbi:uncharacterized protein LOC6582759 isoform X1 [Drosophila mojavensis]|uniref:Tes124 n=4 Tax=mojavensis species complex TaxID=198037 RepID=B4KZA0_DROMO|nr:uncharacterized protein LOC6582759 isoform X1 [Drosophila mojavensis]EDW18926.1 Tes124 [Drosophila mojavensis]